MNYQTVVPFDVNLRDVWFLDTDTLPTGYQGLVWRAVYVTAGSPTAVAGKYAPQAQVQNLADGKTYVMTGSTASPAFTALPVSPSTQYFTVAKDTNGTTPVNVIAATVPFAATITGVYLISKDTTAGNITIADTAGTVATIAKGTTAGAVVGASSLANTSVAAGDTLTIVSSSAGNATVFIAFTVS